MSTSTPSTSCADKITATNMELSNVEGPSRKKRKTTTTTTTTTVVTTTTTTTTNTITDTSLESPDAASMETPSSTSTLDNSTTTAPPNTSIQTDKFLAASGSAASRVFGVFKLLENILLQLPNKNPDPKKRHIDEVDNLRLLFLGQRTCRLWQEIVQMSRPIRKRMFLPYPKQNMTKAPNAQSPKPARANPLIPFAVVGRRGWTGRGGNDLHPFTHFDDYKERGSISHSVPSPPDFILNIGVEEKHKMPPENGSWRDMLATRPFFSRLRISHVSRSSIMEGVSGPECSTWVMGDHEMRQLTTKRASGVTLGMLADSIKSLVDRRMDSMQIRSSPEEIEYDEEVLDASMGTKDDPSDGLTQESGSDWDDYEMWSCESSKLVSESDEDTWP